MDGAKKFFNAHKREMFFGMVACFALGQVVRRELAVKKVVPAEKLGFGKNTLTSNDVTLGGGDSWRRKKKE